MICEAQYGSRTIQFRLKRRKVKSLAIRVHPAGLVEVVAPLNADANEIGRRVARKGRWVLKQQRQFAEILGLPTGRKHRSGESIRYLGRQYRLRIRQQQHSGNAPQGDININQKKIVRPKVIRESGDISETTAFEIQDLIKQLAHIDEIAGKAPSYGGWQQRLKKRFKVASYRKLTVDQGEAAIRWLMQELGRRIPSLRRTNNDEWRQRIYKGIWAAVRELGLEKPQVYQFAYDQLELKNPITSLTELGEQKLESLRDKLRYLARKRR